MPVDPKETLNPHLRRSYRVLVPTFESLVDEHFPGQSDAELAHTLNIEVKTLQSIRQGHVIYGETIRKVSEAFGVPAYAFAENEADADILGAVLEAASDSTKELSRWPLMKLFLKAKHLLRRVNSHWHWSDRLHDPERPFRKIFGEDRSITGFGLFEVEFEGPVFDAILSYELRFGPLFRGRTQAMFGIFIDYGQLYKRASKQEAWSHELWIRRCFHKQTTSLPPNRICFVSWLDQSAGTLIMRSRSAFTIRLKALLSGDEGDRRVQNATDPLVGFLRWEVHEEMEEPWNNSQDNLL